MLRRRIALVTSWSTAPSNHCETRRTARPNDIMRVAVFILFRELSSTVGEKLKLLNFINLDLKKVFQRILGSSLPVPKKDAMVMRTIRWRNNVIDYINHLDHFSHLCNLDHLQYLDPLVHLHHMEYWGNLDHFHHLARADHFHRFDYSIMLIIFIMRVLAKKFKHSSIYRCHERTTTETISESRQVF